MNVQITRIALFQTAKVVGVFYFVAAVVGVVLFFAASLLSPAARPPYAFVVLLISPFVYALLAFVFTIVVAWVYNQIAKVAGGIEFTTVEKREF